MHLANPRLRVLLRSDSAGQETLEVTGDHHRVRASRSRPRFSRTRRRRHRRPGRRRGRYCGCGCRRDELGEAPSGVAAGSGEHRRHCWPVEDWVGRSPGSLVRSFQSGVWQVILASTAALYGVIRGPYNYEIDSTQRQVTGERFDLGPSTR